MALSDELQALVGGIRDLEADRERLSTELAVARSALSLMDASQGLLKDQLTGKTLELGAALSKITDLEAALKACQEAHVPLPSVVWGMSAPADQWDVRLAEVGPVGARRLFGQLASPEGRISLARDEIVAGRLPVLSFKVPNNDWAGAAAGKFDSQFRYVAAMLGTLPGKVFVAVHHEPGNDGTPENFVAMQRRVLPMLKSANVEVGVILNSQWGKPVQTDADIARWLPPDLVELCDVVAADIYQGGTLDKPLEGAGPKIRRMSEWATRVGAKRLGLGEFNCLTASELRDAFAAVKADPRFAWALIFNSAENNRDGVNWVLTGERLEAFRSVL